MIVNGHKIEPDADLRGANLIGADLIGADLRRANLVGAYLEGADLRGSDLRRANLIGAYLEGADLRGSNLERTDLERADLRGAYLEKSNLEGANLRGTDLRGTDLYRAHLYGAYLYGANLRGSNLERAGLKGVIGLNTSSVLGLLSPSKWMKENFESNSDGYIVYKFFGNSLYPSPSCWVIEKGSIIEEVSNLDPKEDCGSGVNFATLKWITKELGDREGTIWKCLLKWEDLVSTCVPYDTDGKARCERLTLLEPID